MKDHIKINGKEYPFWFALKAQRSLSDVKNLADKDDMFYLWIAMKYGAIKEKQKFELTEEQVYDLMDSDVDAWREACNLLSEQMGKLVPPMEEKK
jgi:hypothetical protein